MNQAQLSAPYSKARIIDEPPMGVVLRWLKAGVADFRTHFAASLVYGLGLFALGWGVLFLLFKFDQGWMLLPALAGGLLIGPIATVGLYRLSRTAQGSGDGIASPSQIFLIGVILMIFALSWVRAATLLFAIFFGLLPFAGFAETMTTLLLTPQGIGLLIVGTITGGLFAALGFAVAAFSIPMLVDREIDCFSAMGLSFSATTHNFKLTVLWAICVTSLVCLGVLTGLVGLIPIFPILGFATWHAYSDLFQG